MIGSVKPGHETRATQLFVQIEIHHAGLVGKARPCYFTSLMLAGFTNSLSGISVLNLISS